VTERPKFSHPQQWIEINLTLRKLLGFFKGWIVRVLIYAVVLALSGCAANKGKFYNSPASINTWSLCRSMAESASAGDTQYFYDLNAEAQRRGMTFSDCKTRNAVVEVGVATVVVLGIVAAAMSGRGGGGGGDTSWAWDNFQGQDGSMLWACRGRQTGQFADQWRCSGLPMNDFTWPGPYVR